MRKRFRVAPRWVAVLPLTVLSLGLSFGCATTEKKERPAPSSKAEKPVEARPNREDSSSGSGESASGSRVTVTNSLSNNPLTSQTISTAKAESELAHFKNGKTEAALQGVISTERLARKSGFEVLETAKKLAQLQMEKGAGRTLTGDVKLEIALAALQSHNFALAEYFLQELVESKEAPVRAGAYNALGVVALRDDRVPEAVLYFREALKAVPSYKPALLNLGFAALKGGEINTAKAQLSKIEGDWFVAYGMISINRMEGDVGLALEECDQVLKRQPDHIATLFNCGLVAFQNRHDIAKAKDYLNRAGKAKYGETGWGERAYLLISQIENEEVAEKREQNKGKGDKAKVEPGAAAGGPEPEGGGF